MAKVKTLKKNIGYIAGELFTEVLVAKMLAPSIDKDKVDAILVHILEMQDTFIQRANNPDGKNNKALVKKHYQKLHADLRKEIDKIIIEVNGLGGSSETV